MTAFSFLHAADLHLGSPLKGLSLKDAAVAERFAQAGRRAFTELVSRAIAEGVAFAVIAGDVYDGDWKDNSIGLFFNRELARLEKAGIPVYILRGNHDAESVVTRSIRLPANAWSFETAAPSSFRIEDLKVALHGQGFATRDVTDNLALAYPAPVPGWFNIGVLHTGLTGRENHASYAPCTIEHLRLREYDYWALGHVHDYELVSDSPHIVFPGNLQGRSIRETGEKGAVIVRVDDGRVAGIERLIVDQARWALAEIDISGATDIDDVLRIVEAGLPPLADRAGDLLLALRVRLVGATPLHAALVAGRGQLRDEVQAACHRCGADIWLEKLEIATSQPARGDGAPPAFDLDAILSLTEAEPDLQALAETLLRDIGSKLPAGAEDVLDAGLIPELVAEAHAMLAGRAGAARDQGRT